MSQAIASIDVSAPPRQVWQLIGGFGSLPDWLPYIAQSELHEGGRVRRLANSDGQTIVERLVTFDERARSYSYTILAAPFPVTDYLSTLRVHDSGDSVVCRVEWGGSFTPAGVTDDEASQIFSDIYAGGLKALAKHFDARLL
ncbi:hypothetical protein A5624_10450 [Mycobacterium sp. 1482292.6]|uniref:SRPBCC family protein n=1 Tax=unclassified Mycobacterium TaxID=2642494 RepID=UPI00080095ED|nr:MULTISPECIES: SRPBCC family protein [unclassified Mycobacterium]OBJ12666.1 hypothetical protein A5624_10450 [Mycobacterium sp. 1482292.6]OBJ22730.1 hypothetical protein A5622_14725 [Mycobacterium sp. 1245801.1]